MQAQTRLVHFTIDAEWLTDLVRQLWADEGEPEKAINILKAAFPTMEMADMFAILTGSKQLTGTSDSPGMELAEDDATESKLGNPLDLTKMLAHFREKLDENDDWIQFLTGQTECVPSPEGLIEIPRRRSRYRGGTMMGAGIHGKFIDPSVDLDKIPHKRVYAEDRERVMNGPLADLDRGKLALIEDEDEEPESPRPPPVAHYKIDANCGWLSPEGKFYDCLYGEHIQSAGELGHEEKELEGLNWVKVQNGKFFRGNYDIEPTQRQRDLIFDWCQANNAEMPWLCKSDAEREDDA